MQDLSLPYREMTLAVESVQSYFIEPITIPILLIQAIDDQFIPVETNDQYFEKLCKDDVKNLSVIYIRTSAGKHIQTAILSAPYAALFLQDRFDKVKPFEGCQMMNQSLTLDDPRFLPAIGQDGMNMLKEALKNAASLE